MIRAENSERESTQEDVPEDNRTLWGKWNDHFWGIDYLEYVYAEERMYVPWWLLQTFRIVTLLALIGNTTYRFYYSAEEDIIGQKQLFYTSWSLYITIYTMLFVILTSFYTHHRGYDPEKPWLVNLLLHNNLFFSLSLGMQAVTTLIFWVGIMFFTDIGGHPVSAALDHSLAFFLLITDFIVVNWVFRWTYSYVFIFVSLLYIPVNASYTVTTDDPIYSSITWDGYKTAIFVPLIMLVGVLSFALLLTIARKRYQKHLEENVKIAKTMDPNVQPHDPEAQSVSRNEHHPNNNRPNEDDDSEPPAIPSERE